MKKGAVRCLFFPFLVAAGMFAFAFGSVPFVTVPFEVDGFRSERGRLGVLVYSNAEGFPVRPEIAARRFWVEPVARPTRFSFEWPRGAAYAVAVFHDEDGDGEMARNFLGIPKEGIGTSGSSTTTPSIPRFERSRQVAAEGRPTNVIRIFYLLGR